MIYTSCLRPLKLIEYHPTSKNLDLEYMDLSSYRLIIMVYAKILDVTHLGILYNFWVYVHIPP